MFTARGVASFEGMKPYLDEIGSDFNTYINEGSCNFYGAPVAVIMCIDNSFSHARLVDMGACLGYLVLAAHHLGLWTCPIGLIAAYKDEVKESAQHPRGEGRGHWGGPRLSRLGTPHQPLYFTKG